MELECCGSELPNQYVRERAACARSRGSRRRLSSSPHNHPNRGRAPAWLVGRRCAAPRLTSRGPGEQPTAARRPRISAVVVWRSRWGCVRASLSQAPPKNHHRCDGQAGRVTDRAQAGRQRKSRMNAPERRRTKKEKQRTQRSISCTSLSHTHKQSEREHDAAGRVAADPTGQQRCPGATGAAAECGGAVDDRPTD